MDPKSILDEYLYSHPDYWEFEDELLEVRRLKTLIEQEKPTLRSGRVCNCEKQVKVTAYQNKISRISNPMIYKLQSSLRV